jgi:hypothetical protein
MPIHTRLSVDAINEIKGRMTTLESSLSHLIAISTSSSARSPQNTSRKRARTEAWHGDIFQKLSRSSSPCIAAGSESNPTPPFSANEAQTLIQEELSHGPSLSMTKQAAFHSALSSLKQTLNTSIKDHESPDSTTSERTLEDLQIPHITLIQWMLQCRSPERTDRHHLTKTPSQ